MAVLTVTERRHERKVTISEQSRQGRRVYLVQTDVPVFDPLVILAATGLPRLAAAWVTTEKTDTFLRVVNLDPTQLGDTEWEVEIQYQTPGDIPTGFIGENPLEKEPDVRFDFIDSEEQFDHDLDGFPYLNASLESADPKVTRPISDFRLIFERNEANFSATFAKQFKDTVNSDAFVGLDAGTWRITGISARRQIESGLRFYRVSYKFDGRDVGPSGIHLIPSFAAGGYTLTPKDFPSGSPPWNRRKLNEAMREKIGTLPGGEPEFRQFTDADGNLLTEPTLVDKNGLALLENQKPLFILHRDFDEVPFAPLGIEV